MSILLNLIDLGHHGHIELVANLLGTEIITVEISRFDALLEFCQTHELSATRERGLANVALIQGLKRHHRCLQGIVNLFLPEDRLTPVVRIKVLPAWEQLCLEHAYETLSNRLHFISSGLVLNKLGVTHADEDFQEVVPDEVILRVELAVLFISIGLDSFKIEIRQFKGLSIDQILSLSLN